jgi:hypothetical protein
MRAFLLGFSLFSVAVYSTTAHAQDMDLDEAEKKKKTRASKKVEIDRNVREIERGLYSKANVGAMINILAHPSPITNPVHSLALSIGDDFVDRESLSMAWEVSFLQTVQNGIAWEAQPENIANPNDFFQGDTRGFALLGAYEISKYPSRRFGIGLRLAAGIMGMPLNIHETAYNEKVLPTWGLGDSPNNSGIYIPVGGGPTFEYYTKLAHFSVGVDADVLYIVGWDLSVNPMGYMKYTF